VKRAVKIWFSLNGEFHEAEIGKLLFDNKVDRIKRVGDVDTSEHFEILFEGNIGSLWIYNPQGVLWANQEASSSESQPPQ